MKHLFISFIVVKWDDRDPVVDLEGETINAIVNDHNVLQVSIAKYPKILDVVTLLC